MRPAIVVLVLAATAGLAFAEPPAAPPAESRSATAQDTTGEDSARQSSASGTAPAAASATTAGNPATAAASPAPKAADEPADEKMLRLQGYKPQMLGGDMVYCRREIPLGSHLPSTLKCITPAQAKLMAEEGRRTTERIQRNQVGCLQPAAGGCGN